ncbi:hypothetical protein I5Q34_13720 [Streptomyces sp. AV19]|uniref:hypothetical protein n=1 Tax=Streptomyces sp. AV19 TaxID=2793068 RepID=UPI0018FE0AE0|nr:hypothetical protein [Streptomyces sp. AV19]MBH1935318.1 hypothetical protein [Streptomyces sp. AV19]
MTAPEDGPPPPQADRQHPQADRPPPQAPDDTAARHTYVNQVFHGPLHAPQAHFGIGPAASMPPPAAGARRATGRLDAGEIDSVLRCYVEPPCFREAADALAADTVTVLVGPPGTGKRSGAVALLKEVAHSSVYVVLSPDIGLEQLAERAFDRGIGYVLLDRMNEDAEGGGTRTADFDWRRVRDRVRGQGAHLVVTTVHEPGAPPPEAVRHVPWRAPDLGEVLRARLREAGCAGRAAEEAAGLMPGGCLVAEVAAAAGRIARGEEPRAVWREYGSSAAQPVRDWFAADRTPREIAEVTTLAFATGTGRRAFERLQESLEPYVVRAFGDAPPPPEGVPETAPAPPVDRRRSLARNALVAAEERAHGVPGRTVWVFAVPQYRQWVLEELWANHSSDFWDGVRDWLTALVAARPDGELRASVASGLALLARTAFDEVADCYLRPWARGGAGPEGEVMAAHVLWWICLDETLAAAALTLVRGWAHSGDPGLRSAAARAFGGQLGVRFPTDAVKRLWHLIHQGQGRPAVLGMAHLFALLADGQEDAGVVLDALVHRLRKQCTTPVATRVKAMTFDTVLAVLSVGEPGTGRPAVAGLVERRPRMTDRVAALWAGVLRHRPVRQAGLTALRDTLLALPAVCRDARATAGSLGRALGAALPPDERRLLAAALGRDAGRRRRVEPAVLDGFLTAVRGVGSPGGAQSTAAPPRTAAPSIAAPSIAVLSTKD